MPPLRSGPVNRRQQTVRVVTKREGASERIDYLVDLWSCIIDIRDNDVIPAASVKVTIVPLGYLTPPEGPCPTGPLIQ